MSSFHIESSVNSLCKYIVIPDMDLVLDHHKRYFAVPHDYRPDGNPFDDDPGRSWFSDIGTPEAEAFNKAMNLMSHIYWKILADEAESTYNK